MPGKHTFFITVVPIYFDKQGKYIDNNPQEIGFTVPQDTQIEIWNHGNKSKIRWFRKSGSIVRKTIEMNINEVQHLFENKSAR